MSVCRAGRSAKDRGPIPGGRSRRSPYAELRMDQPGTGCSPDWHRPSKGAEMRTYRVARRAHRCDARPGSWLGRSTARRAVGPLLERVRPRRAGTGRSPSAPSRTVSTSRSRKRHVRPCVVSWARPIVATTGRGGGVAWAGQGCRLEADVLVRAIRQTSPEPSRRIGRGPR